MASHPRLVSALLAAAIVADLALKTHAALTIREAVSHEPAPVATDAARGQPSIARILAGHLFGVSPVNDAAAAAAVQAQGVALRLTGTLADSDAPERGLALFSGAGDTQRLVAAGSPVAADRLLVAVYADHVELDHLGVRETLKLHGATAAVRRAVPAIRATPEAIEARVESSAGSSSRMLSVDDMGTPDRFRGVVFTSAADSAGLGALGVHSGDRLELINGVRVTSPEALAELAAPGVLTLGVMSDGGYHVVRVDSSRLH